MFSKSKERYMEPLANDPEPPEVASESGVAKSET